MSTDPKDKELTNKEAGDVAGGKSRETDYQPEDLKIEASRELTPEHLDGVKGAAKRPPADERQ